MKKNTSIGFPIVRGRLYLADSPTTRWTPRILTPCDMRRSPSVGRQRHTRTTLTDVSPLWVSQYRRTSNSKVYLGLIIQRKRLLFHQLGQQLLPCRCRSSFQAEMFWIFPAVSCVLSAERAWACSGIL